MKNQILLIFAFSLFGSCKAQESTNCDCSVIIILKGIQIPLYSESNKKEIITYLLNDTIKEEYYNINIYTQIEQMFKVSGSTPHDTVNRNGWIETKYIGIYPSIFDEIKLYTKPDTTSKVMSTIIKPEYYPFSVIKCHGKWLYVKYLDTDKKTKEGWLSPDNQCSNPYTTCN
jgi:hypothetical protein